jgi:hypothetical protein
VTPQELPCTIGHRLRSGANREAGPVALEILEERLDREIDVIK